MALECDRTAIITIRHTKTVCSYRRETIKNNKIHVPAGYYTCTMYRLPALTGHTNPITIVKY